MGALACMAQVGEHRNRLLLGASGGYVLGSVGFSPKVTQGLHGGMTVGGSAMYVCEKYFNTICSICAEVNYTQAGWKEDIVDVDDQPVVNPQTGLAEAYERTMDYIQVPVFAHLAWGRETKGCQFFVQAGPQFGYLLGEKTTSNFLPEERNLDDRANPVCAQETMAAEHRFDYGIAAGAGIQYGHPRVGNFVLEARYYYGLGNIYGDSKKDYFGKSNHGQIIIKLAYLHDIIKTKK